MKMPWPIVPFASVLTLGLRNGTSPSSDGDTPGLVLTLSAVTGSRFDPTAIKPAMFRGRLPDTQYVNIADFLICRGNGNLHLVGRGQHPLADMSDVVFPDTIIAARTNAEIVDMRFLGHAWNSPFVRKQIESAARTTNGTFKVNQTMIENILIPLPPIGEQRRIVDVLDRTDALRGMRQQTLAILGELTTSLFVDLFGDPLAGMKWPSLPFASIVKEFRYGTSNKSGTEGYPALRIPNVIGGSLDLTEIKTVPVSESEQARLRLADGDILFVRTNGNPSYVGRCAAFRENDLTATNYRSDQFIYASYLIRARLDQAHALPDFVREFMLSVAGRKAMLERCKTSAGQYNINIDGLGSIEIPLPPLELQEVFSAKLRQIDALRANVRRGERELGVLFESLQARAFRGEL
jgi:type I restriction enzyme S subunit